MLQQYDRPEVSGQNALAVPTMFDFDLLFQRKDRPAAKDMSDPAEQCDWEKEAKLLNGVLKPISWPTASPASAQNNYIDLSLMIYLSTVGDWSLAERAWHAELLLEGEVLLKGGRYYFIVHTYLRGAVTWPLVKIGTNTLFFDLACTRLNIVHCFDVDAFKVVPTTAVSMLHHEVFGLTGCKGVRLKVTGEAVSIADFQVSRGFKGVNEHTLRKMYDLMNLTLPVLENDAMQADSAMSLSVDLMCQLSADMTEDAAVSILMKRKFGDEPVSDVMVLDKASLKSGETSLPTQVLGCSPTCPRLSFATPAS